MKYFFKTKTLPDGSHMIEDAKSSEVDISKDSWIEINSDSYHLFMQMVNNPNSLINTRKAYAELCPLSYIGVVNVALDPNQERQDASATPNNEGIFELYPNQ